MGRVPDGKYTATSASLWNSSDLDLVTAALNDIVGRLRGGASSADVNKVVAEKYPFLKGIARYAPKTPDSLVAYLTLALAAASFLQSCKEKAPEQSIQFQTEIHLILSEAARDIPPSQHERKGQQ